MSKENKGQQKTAGAQLLSQKKILIFALITSVLGLILFGFFYVRGLVYNIGFIKLSFQLTIFIIDFGIIAALICFMRETYLTYDMFSKLGMLGVPYDKAVNILKPQKKAFSIKRFLAIVAFPLFLALMSTFAFIINIFFLTSLTAILSVVGGAYFAVFISFCGAFILYRTNKNIKEKENQETA